jgi:hypothetical protein
MGFDVIGLDRKLHHDGQHANVLQCAYGQPNRSFGCHGTTKGEFKAPVSQGRFGFPATHMETRTAAHWQPVTNSCVTADLSLQAAIAHPITSDLSVAYRPNPNSVFKAHERHLFWNVPAYGNVRELISNGMTI